VIAEVETDKATMELESYDDGVLLHLAVKDGESVAVDAPLYILGEKGEDISDLLKEFENPSSGGGDSKEEKPESKEEEKASAPNVDVSSIPAKVITMPLMSDTMTEGTIAAWHKKVGDNVSSGDLLAEIETDKATMELESYEDGTLLYRGAEEGDAVAVEGLLAIVGEKGADYQALVDNFKSSKSSDNGQSEKEEDKQADAAKEPQDTPESKPAATESVSEDDSRVKASPLARKLAKEKGYNLNQIQGSGPNGRVIKKDVEDFTPQAQPSTATSGEQQKIELPRFVGEESFEEQNISQMRKTIARRLSDSKFTAPHFYLTMQIDMDKAIEARKSMNEISPVKISFNDLVVKAVAIALRKHPAVNSSWLGDKIRTNHHVHIGVAVAVDEGLLVPVIRFADNKTLSHISAEVKDLAGKAKDKKLQPSDWEGNTFTISNLGMFGIDEFTAIVNPPDSCIMAVGGIQQTPVVKNGEIVPGNIMKVTMSCDHRVVDGATGAAFLQTFKGLLEDPVRLLV
jgi:pyruvate dehydrogenase E2 component (dihydrolipoamide acetyltransferase)